MLSVKLVNINRAISQIWQVCSIRNCSVYVNVSKYVSVWKILRFFYVLNIKFMVVSVRFV